MQDIECVFQSMSGRGSIYISNLPAAQNVQLLHSKGIKGILSVTRSGLLHHSKEEIPYYLYIPAEDHEDYHLTQHFQETFEFIEKARKQTNVLVHCMVGVSRSVTIVTAYLLKKYKFPLEQIMNMIYRRRRKINPNRGFIQQLKKYAEVQGVKCEMSSDYLKVLRGHSSSRNKKIHETSREKIKKITTAVPKQKSPEPAIANLIIASQKMEEPVSPPAFFKLRKTVSFDESRNIENQQNLIENQLVKMSARNEVVVEMKKSVSVNQKQKGKEQHQKVRRLSIEEKIRKVRDRILKQQEVRTDGFIKKNAQYSPIYKKSPRRLEDSSLEKLNRVNKQQETVKSPTITMSNNENNLFKTFEQRTSSSKWNCPPSTNTKAEESDNLFSDDLKIQANTLYSPLRPNKRWNSKLNHQN